MQHPLCVDHYEVDVHWSILDFLFALAYNPTGALKRNKHKIEIKPVECEDISANDTEKAYWVNVLKEDFITMPENDDTDSELSVSKMTLVIQSLESNSPFSGSACRSNGLTIGSYRDFQQKL